MWRPDTRRPGWFTEWKTWAYAYRELFQQLLLGDEELFPAYKHWQDVGRPWPLRSWLGPQMPRPPVASAAAAASAAAPVYSYVFAESLRRCGVLGIPYYGWEEVLERAPWWNVYTTQGRM